MVMVRSSQPWEREREREVLVGAMQLHGQESRSGVQRKGRQNLERSQVTAKSAGEETRDRAECTGGDKLAGGRLCSRRGPLLDVEEDKNTRARWRCWETMMRKEPDAGKSESNPVGGMDGVGGLLVTRVRRARPPSPDSGHEYSRDLLNASASPPKPARPRSRRIASNGALSRLPHQ